MRYITIRCEETQAGALRGTCYTEKRNRYGTHLTERDPNPILVRARTAQAAVVAPPSVLEARLALGAELTLGVRGHSETTPYTPIGVHMALFHVT